MSNKEFETPREAAAAVIEVNNVYRLKLAKASSLLKQKNVQIRQLESTRNQLETDNEYIKKLEEQVQTLLSENQNLENMNSELNGLRSENAALKEHLENITTTVATMKQATTEQADSKSRIATIHQITAESNKQLLIASMHIAGLDAELKAFKDHHPQSDLLNASQETYEDGRKKSISRIIYEEAFDSRGAELGVSKPVEFRPR